MIGNSGLPTKPVGTLFNHTMPQANVVASTQALSTNTTHWDHSLEIQQLSQIHRV